MDLIFQKQKHEKGPAHFSTVLEKQKMVFEIYPLSKNQSMLDTSTRLGFRVDDLEKTIHAILEIGGEVKNEIRITEFGTFGIVKDFDGRSVEVYQK